MSQNGKQIHLFFCLGKSMGMSYSPEWYTQWTHLEFTYQTNSSEDTV